MEDRLLITKSALLSLTASMLDFFFPIHNFLLVIAGLATVNIILGAAASDEGWRFRKAFKAIWYLIGYMALIIASFTVGFLMKMDTDGVSKFISWMTWVMVWFYSTNSLKNWNKIQPDNRIIAFLYWVVSIKFIDKVSYLSEYLKSNKNENKQERN